MIHRIFRLMGFRRRFDTEQITWKEQCTAAELERVLRLDLDPERVMLGINNRDLQTFIVDLQNNQRIMDSTAGQEVSLSHGKRHPALLCCLGPGPLQ
jgi:indole-3-glycerol phosphate synthase